jgi:hypothetical protein
MDEHELSVRLDANIASFDAGIAQAERRLSSFEGTAREKARQLVAHWRQQEDAARAGSAQVATSVQQTTRATAAGAASYTRLTGSMVNMAAAVLPLNAGVLRFSTLLGSLATSGGIMFAATAVATGLAAAWSALTREARAMGEAADKAGESIQAMWLEMATAGDIKLINQINDVGTRLDDLHRQQREAERDAAGPAAGGIVGDANIQAAQGRVRALQREIDAETKVRDRGQQLLDQQRAKRQKEEADREIREQKRIAAERRRAAAEAKRLALDETKTAEERFRALTTLVAAGWASVEQTNELRAAQERFRTVLRDGTADIAKRAQALEDLTRVTNALTDAQMRAIRLSGVGGAGSTGGPLLGAPRTPSGRLTTDRRGQVLSDTPRDILGGIGENARVGPAGAEIMQVMQAAAAGMGPFALLLPIINSALEALEPVLTLLLEPLKVLGKLIAAQLTPVIRLLIPPLKIVATIATYFTQALGWLIAAIGKAINFLLPGNPANGMVRAGREMQAAARDARESLRNMGKEADNVIASLRNVPIAFNTAFARYQIGTGSALSRTSSSQVRPGGGISINSVIIQASPTGDTPESLWRKFEQGADRAAANGNVLARSLVLRPAGV